MNLGSADVNDTPCTHERTETVNLSTDWFITICNDCGRLEFHTPNITIELFFKVTWRRGYRPDTDKKESK